MFRLIYREGQTTQEWDIPNARTWASAGTQVCHSAPCAEENALAIVRTDAAVEVARTLLNRLPLGPVRRIDPAPDLPRPERAQPADAY